MFFPVIGGPGFRLRSSARNQHKGLYLFRLEAPNERNPLKIKFI